MKFFIFICFIFFITRVQSRIEGLNNINDLSKFINNDQLGDIDAQELYEQGTAKIKEKCVNASGKEETYDNLVKGAENLGTCLEKFVNVTVLEQEIKINSKTGDLDTVFNKYCKKKNEAIECLETFANKIEDCLETEEKEFMDLGKQFLRTVSDFVCYRDGDYIALFIAEGGPECYEKQAPGLQTCIESFARRYVIEQPGSTIPKFNTASFDCEDLEIIRKCTVDELEKCTFTTPANLLDSMFRQIKKECIRHKK